MVVGVVVGVVDHGRCEGHYGGVLLHCCMWRWWVVVYCS